MWRTRVTSGACACLSRMSEAWNRRPPFQTTIERILGIGQVLPRTIYRDIVGEASA